MSLLLRLIVLRRLATEPGRSLLTLLGVALGVAVFVSIRLASHSALASFSDTVDAVTGRANLQISSNSDGFDERLYREVLDTPGILAAAPIVEVHVLAAAGPPPEGGGDADSLTAGPAGPWRESLLILGVDPFSEAPFVRGDVASAGAQGADSAGWRRAFLALTGEPATVAVTRAFAERNGLEQGDTVSVLASGVPTPLRIVQLLGGADLQQAHGGNVAITDIATAQEIFHRSGRLDRIDLLVEDGARDGVRRALAARVPADVSVDLPRGRTRLVENLVRAFDLNLTALTFIALFVSLFLVFNTVAMSVVRWRREIGILRGLGVTRGGIARLFVGEGLVLGAIGSALGLVLGTLLARFTLGAVGQTLEALYLVQRTRELRLDATTYVVGAALGLASSFVAALVPAAEAALVPPGVTMRQGQLIEARRPPVGRIAWLGVLVLALGGLVAAWTMQAEQPWGGFVSAFAVIAGCTLLAPGATLLGERLVRGPAERANVAASLGVRALRETVTRASGVVAAVMIAVGMMVALQVMVGSFRSTVDTWITQTLKGDLYVEPAGHRQSLGATVLPRELLDGVRAIPGVAAVDTYRATLVRMRDRLAFVVGIDFDVQRLHGGLSLTSHERREVVLARALAAGEVLVSESFTHRQRVRAGDTIVLPAPAGATRVRIAGVYYDYSTDAGVVLMDRHLFARLWRDDRTESLALYLEPGADADAVRAAFFAAAGPNRLFHVTPNQALRRRVLDVFDQTFRITFALQAIALLVAVLGIVSTLTALILQRSREIGVLRACGALRAQVRTMVLVESGLLGLVGALLGCAAGVLLALLLVFVINRQFFGWSIRFTLDPWTLVQAVVLMVIAALIAGLGPARLAASRLAAEAMRID